MRCTLYCRCATVPLAEDSDVQMVSSSPDDLHTVPDSDVEPSDDDMDTINTAVDSDNDETLHDVPL